LVVGYAALSGNTLKDALAGEVVGEKDGAADEGVPRVTVLGESEVVGTVQNPLELVLHVLGEIGAAAGCQGLSQKMR